MLFKHFKTVIAAGLVLLSACNSGQTTQSGDPEAAKFHKIKVQEVLQASEYTYLHGSDDNKDIWLAVPLMQAKPGDTYYYEGGIAMQHFESKDLHRTFDNILLLEKLNTEPKSGAVAASAQPYTPQQQGAAQPSAAAPATGDAGNSNSGEGYTRKATPPEKKEIKVEKARGGISIAELYNHKDNYAGKTIIVRGQVVKYTPAVMNKNWIHIQDGTDAGGKFDLAVTSGDEVKIGDVVTFEGKISLNKDLGYGYFFDVIMEDAQLKK